MGIVKANSRSYYQVDLKKGGFSQWVDGENKIVGKKAETTLKNAKIISRSVSDKTFYELQILGTDENGAEEVYTFSLFSLSGTCVFRGLLQCQIGDVVVISIFQSITESGKYTLAGMKRGEEKLDCSKESEVNVTWPYIKKGRSEVLDEGKALVQAKERLSLWKLQATTIK